MPRNKKIGKKQHHKNFGDITINDYANASTCTDRLKKSSSNVSTVIKQLETENKTWDEKNDFDEDFDLVQEENEDGTTSVVLKKIGPQRCKKVIFQGNTGTGNYYPLDIWFLISDYIRPEDVATFATICKTSFAVTCTAKFWFGLYKRYYQTVPELPERLQPECLQRFYGLRTGVIRSLYYMYPPFVSRLKGEFKTFEKYRDLLIRRQCRNMWYQKKSKLWSFYFKLKENTNSTIAGCRRSEKPRRPDLIEMLDDISANPDENCRLLLVTCSHYIAVPIVLGLTLTSVSLTLSEGFRHHRLQLCFGSAVHYSVGGSNSTTVVLDPVVKIMILDWWHPLYPHDSNLVDLLRQE